MLPQVKGNRTDHGGISLTPAGCSPTLVSMSRIIFVTPPAFPPTGLLLRFRDPTGRYMTRSMDKVLRISRASAWHKFKRSYAAYRSSIMVRIAIGAATRAGVSRDLTDALRPMVPRSDLRTRAQTDLEELQGELGEWMDRHGNGEYRELITALNEIDLTALASDGEPAEGAQGRELTTAIDTWSDRDSRYREIITRVGAAVSAE